MKRQFFLSLFAMGFYTMILAQSPAGKMLDHEDFAIWKKLEQPRITNDGRWVSYVLRPGEGDPQLVIFDGNSFKKQTFQRAEGAHFSEDSRFLVFKIKPFADSLKAMRRRKVKKKDLPQDTLGIYRLEDKKLEKIPGLKSFQLPEKWAGWLAYQLEIAKADTSSSKGKNVKKKESKEQGSRLIVRNLLTERQDTIGFVNSYTFAEEGKRFLMHSTGDDSSFLAGVYLYDCAAASLQAVFRSKGKYKKLSFDRQGRQLAFTADLDTTQNRIRPYGLYYWREGRDSAQLVAGKEATFLTNGWLISEHATLNFSRDGSKLFFGIAPPPILRDTSLLEEEIVNVEVWSYTDARLHTQQKVLLEREKKRAYTCVFHTASGNIDQLGSLDFPEIRLGNEGNAGIVLAYNEQPYLQRMSWEGFPSCKDLFLLDLETNSKKLIARKICGTPRFSPSAAFVYWYSQPDTAWFAYSLEKDRIKQITTNEMVRFYNELNDLPMHPSPYGMAAWLENDAFVLINDRYDIWMVDPKGVQPALNLTKGREVKLRFRYIQLDPEKRFIKAGERILLHVFDEKYKREGYAWLDLSSRSLSQIQFDNYAYSRRPLKAKNARRYVFTKENFNTFPDFLFSSDLVNYRRISNANPQQENYSWGSIELYEWTSLDGQQLQGLLVKPENFDPGKQYPMIVNFYERSSNGLHRHRAPQPHRSTINYSFYASRGYLIFNPDVPYRVGYPGESAYNAVISGVSSLNNEGFVDKNNIGVQGHSWGGYQIAYLLTKTDIFKCAESGAPVVNMISAYGGIRWGSGISRMFQYEHTQSRIGGTLWEYPLRYIENSPIFFADKINTPVLILHNDNDGAVPWYQGIEFFLAMRRQGKPAWLLNYNGEPHWPVKLQNRKDFQKRMSQFFDHYLKGAPKPKWMERGVPAIEKGILQGLEPAKE